MRIIAGRFRGRRLIVPEGLSVRPTSDRARGALFDMLRHGKPAGAGFRLEGARVLDAFAGTGALGLEALSRGAEHATFFEPAPAARAALKRNIAACRAEAEILAVDATEPPPAATARDLALLDPPYGEGLAGPALTALTGAGWFAKDAIACVETARDDAFEVPPGFEEIDDRRHGAARLRILIWRG
jgi:16S rRNA (guanine966-N2)-methyltransferase